jgi:hypothetical protein
MSPPLKPISPYGEGRRPQPVDVKRDGVTRKEIRHVGSLRTTTRTKPSKGLRSATTTLGSPNSSANLPAPVAALVTPTHLFPQQLVELPVDTPPASDRMKPIKNRARRNKPEGGLWTGTRTGATTSTWTEWRDDADYAHHHQSSTWAINLPDDATVLRINSSADLQTLIDHFGHQPDDSQPLLDYEKLAAAGVHGVWLTSEGEASTRLPEGDSPDLYGWDMECTLWLNLPPPPPSLPSHKTCGCHSHLILFLIRHNTTKHLLSVSQKGSYCVLHATPEP